MCSSSVLGAKMAGITLDFRLAHLRFYLTVRCFLLGGRQEILAMQTALNALCATEQGTNFNGNFGYLPSKICCTRYGNFNFIFSSGWSTVLARYGGQSPPLPANPCEELSCPADTTCQLKRAACLIPLLPCPVVGVCAPATPTYSLDRREEEPLTLQVGS
jgi:hypothetical protein